MNEEIKGAALVGKFFFFIHLKKASSFKLCLNLRMEPYVLVFVSWEFKWVYCHEGFHGIVYRSKVVSLEFSAQIQFVKLNFEHF